MEQSIVIKDRDSLIAEHSEKGNWVVYIISSVPNPGRTYCGVTNDLKHRLRQHNGEIKGGAVATIKDRPWILSALVVGFGKDKCLALRYEWFCKVKHYNRNHTDLYQVSSYPPHRRYFLMDYAMKQCMESTPDAPLYVCICDQSIIPK